jgi:hypothetical protein
MKFRIKEKHYQGGDRRFVVERKIWNLWWWEVSLPAYETYDDALSAIKHQKNLYLSKTIIHNSDEIDITNI